MLHLDAKTKEKKEKKKLGKKLNKDLTPLEKEKARFTKYKILLSTRLKAVKDVNDPETVKLREKARKLYHNIEALYNKVVSQWNRQIVELDKSISDITASYELAKYNLDALRVERNEQRKVGASITEKFLSHAPVRPEHKKDKLRLSRDERKFINEEALFYKELYDEATRDIEQEIVFSESEKAAVEEINALMAKKDILLSELKSRKEENSRVKKRLADHIYRNKGLISPGGGGGDITVDDDDDDDVSPKMRVEAQLLSGDYEALGNAYDHEHREYFIKPLIHMYQMKNVNEIGLFSSSLIDLLVQPVPTEAIRLYEKLLNDDYISKEDVPRRFWPLVPKIHSMSKIEAFTEIMRLIDGNNEEEEEEEEANAVSISDIFITEQTEKIERRKAELLFAPYQLTKREAAESLSQYVCVYIAQTTQQQVAITMVLDRSDAQDTIYELLAEKEGFALLIQLFRLEIFPDTVADPCPLLRHRLHAPTGVYVTEFLPMTLERMVGGFEPHDKFCVLFELITTLHDAKLKYGIEHNQLDLLNIRVKRVDDVSRSYITANGSKVECRSPYRVTLVDFSKASLNVDMVEEERQLLIGLDYMAFYRVATIQEMLFSDHLIESLSALKETTFDNLMMLLGDEAGETK